VIDESNKPQHEEASPQDAVSAPVASEDIVADESEASGVTLSDAGPASPDGASDSDSSNGAAADDVAGAGDADETLELESELAVADEDEEESGNAGPIEEIDLSADEEITTNWYILKVQSNREESIRDGLWRRVKVAGLERYFTEIIVPTEDVAEFKNGKKRISKRKLYPGYIVVNMSINDDTWFLVRETPGIGDFTGSAGKPTPMLTHEVERIVKSTKKEEEGGEPVKTVIPFKIADRVRIKEGTFENFEGDVDGIDEANGRVTVMINIFGRSTPVELEHWQIEAV
jgi:transcriptional antiterminator NusG